MATVYDLQSPKGTRKWLQIHVDSGSEAAAAVEAGITILSCEPDHALEREVHAKRVDALRSFAKDVEAGADPERKHEIRMNNDDLAEFLSKAAKH